MNNRGMSVAAWLCGVVVGGGAVSGCKTVPQSRYDEAVTENSELRDRLAEVQDTLRASEDEKAAALNRNDSLASEVARLQTEVAARPTASSVAPSGSGMQPGMSMRGSDVVVTVAGDVLFGSGSAILKPDGRRELDRVARLLVAEYSPNLIRVEGHTDSDPIRKSKWKTNERLSAERALVVEEYLVSRGVEADRIYSAGMGSASPKATKAKSRRVEIVILAGR